MKEKVSTPEGVPRLFDLIKVQDERMKLAFFAALGNTVVAKDIDQVYYSHSLLHSFSFLKHKYTKTKHILGVLLWKHVYTIHCYDCG